MSSRSPIIAFPGMDEAFVRATYSGATELPPSTDLGPRTASSSQRVGISRFGNFAATFAAAAAFAAPAVPSLHRRILSGSQGGGTVSGTFAFAWDFDGEWVYSEARISDAEVEALERLYALSPLAEGLTLELPDA